MKYQRILSTCIAAFLFCSVVSAQKPEVTISLNETFFDSLLDAVFQNAAPIQFSIAANDRTGAKEVPALALGFASKGRSACKEVIQLLRESNGIRTSVRFRDGKILAPLAFTGNYNPPLVGCVPFSGYAENAIELEFDQQNQKLIARAKVLNVSLNGTGGVGGTLIARMVQGSIDRKINPIEVLTLEKISFLLPLKKDSNMRMKASSVRHEIVNGALNVVIAYDFVKV